MNWVLLGRLPVEFKVKFHMNMAVVDLGRSAARATAAGRTAVVMMDTRPVRKRIDRALHMQYPQLAFELNRGYACAHGYDILYLHMQSDMCEHEHLGTRHPSYCKLAAVAEAFHRGYSHVAFVDR